MMQQPLDDRRTLNRLKFVIALALVVATVVLASRPRTPEYKLTVAPPTAGGTASLPTVTLTGTAAPGASIGVYADDSRIATAFTPMDGKWRATFDRPRRVPEKYRVEMLNANMDTIASESIRSEADPIAKDTAANKKFAMIQPADGELVHPGTWLVTGTGQPLHKVKLYLDDTIQLREVTIGQNRKWSANVVVKAGGRYRNLKAIMVDPDGKQVDYEEVRLDVAAR